MPVAVEWVPVHAAGLPGGGPFEAFRCAEERDIALARRRAHGGRARPAARALARPVPVRQRLRDAGRDVRAADRAHGRVRARRLPPGLRGRPLARGLRERPDRGERPARCTRPRCSRRAGSCGSCGGAWTRATHEAAARGVARRPPCGCHRRGLPRRRAARATRRRRSAPGHEARPRSLPPGHRRGGRAPAALAPGPRRPGRGRSTSTKARSCSSGTSRRPRAPRAAALREDLGALDAGEFWARWAAFEGEDDLGR